VSSLTQNKIKANSGHSLLSSCCILYFGKN